MKKPFLTQFLTVRAAFLVMLGVALLAGLILTETIQWPAMIHDISTDLENPPAFEALLPLRKGASNPPEYPGAIAAREQQRRYPDIKPLIVAAPWEQVFSTAASAAEAMGWRVIATDPGQGRIEAVATTRWLRFKDDIVVRLSRVAEGVKIDVRSKSRIGRSDLGANARRIRAFLAILQEGGLKIGN